MGEGPMPKKLLALVIFILCIQFLSGVSVDMKQSYLKGETIIANISGNFIDQISEENVLFYRGSTRVPAIYEVGTIQGMHMLYALISSQVSGNYSVLIKGVRYMDGTEIVDEPIILNFTILNESADFSIVPGFVFTDKDFSIMVKNLKHGSLEISVSDGRKFNLKEGEFFYIPFSIQNFSSRYSSIVLDGGSLSYEIPVEIFGNSFGEDSNYEDFPPQVEGKSLKFGPTDGLIFSMSTNSSSERIVYLYNNGNQTLSNISLELSEELTNYASISSDTISLLEPGESFKLRLFFNSSSEACNLSGTLAARSEDVEAFLRIDVSVEKGYTPFPGTNNKNASSSKIKNCSQMGGLICDQNEVCEGEEVYARDGKCCLGSCKAKKSRAHTKLLGWILILAVFLFVVYFLKRKSSKFKKR